MFFNKTLTPQQQFMLAQQQMKNTAIASNMVNTMVPGTTPSQQMVKQELRKQPKVRKGIDIIIRVTNNNPNDENVLLFDALGAYALQNNYTLPPGVVIEYVNKQGIGSSSYAYLLNYIATGTVLYFQQLNLQVSNQLQYDRSIGIYEDTLRANNVSLYDTINPSAYLNSMQNQQNRVEIPYEYKINRASAWLYTQEANSTLTFRMFCEEMVGTGL